MTPPPPHNETVSASTAHGIQGKLNAKTSRRMISGNRLTRSVVIQAIGTSLVESEATVRGSGKGAVVSVVFNIRTLDAEWPLAISVREGSKEPRAIAARAASFERKPGTGAEIRT